MQRSAKAGIRIPSSSNEEQVENIVERKLAMETTEMISNDGTAVLTMGEWKKPNGKPKRKKEDKPKRKKQPKPKTKPKPKGKKDK